MKADEELGNLEAVTAHVSDLHFCDVFCNTEDRLSSLIGAAPHYYPLLAALEACFRGIPTQLQIRFGLEIKHAVDIVIATGDLTTTATPVAFEEANNFLRGSKYVGVDGPRIGLEMERDVLVIPGNHDTWFTRIGLRYLMRRVIDRSEAYEKYFPKCPDWNVRQFGNADFLFIGLNSNKGLRGLLNISRGRIDESELADVANRLGTYKDTSTRKVFTIILLHHHPYLPPDKDEQELTKLLNAEKVMSALSSMRADMVLFGHRHESFEAMCPPALSQGSSLLVSCVGSACQMGSRQGNSFKIYLFFHHGIRIVEYAFDGSTRFNPVATFKFDYPNGSPFTYDTIDGCLQIMVFGVAEG